MTREESEQFLAMAANTLGLVMRLHDAAVRLVGSTQTPQYRIDGLFARAAEEPATRLHAYREVAPGVAFGFEDTEVVMARLHGTPQERGGNRVRIELSSVGQSRWFSLEVDLPWTAIRPSERLEIAIAGAASRALACSALLTAFDRHGSRHDLGSSDLAIRQMPGTARATLDYALPETTQISFEVEPKLILFFPVEPFTLDLDYIELVAAKD